MFMSDFLLCRESKSAHISLLKQEEAQRKKQTLTNNCVYFFLKEEIQTMFLLFIKMSRDEPGPEAAVKGFADREREPQPALPEWPWAVGCGLWVCGLPVLAIIVSWPVWEPRCLS